MKIFTSSKEMINEIATLTVTLIHRDQTIAELTKELARINELEQDAIVPEGMVQVPRALLSALYSYGLIHTVEGVRYPYGSHKELLEAASDLLAAMEQTR